MTGRRWWAGVVAAGLALTLLTGCGQHASTGSASTPVHASSTADTATVPTAADPATSETVSSPTPAATAPPVATTAATTSTLSTATSHSAGPPPDAQQSSALNQVNADLSRVDAGTAQTDKDLSAAASAQAQDDQP
jgi:hypothetical protein